MGSARIKQLHALDEFPEHLKRFSGSGVEVDVPSHLLWEVRGVQKKGPAATEDDGYLRSMKRIDELQQRVEIYLDGDRRMVRDQIPVTHALFETGKARPEDVLFCPDGSCGLCQVTVDGVKKLACQEVVHKGMNVKLSQPVAPTQGENSLCPCLGITLDEVVERLKSGSLTSVDAAIAVTQVTEGKCHGQLCCDAFKRALSQKGLDGLEWTSWKFPFSEWVLDR